MYSHWLRDWLVASSHKCVGQQGCGFLYGKLLLRSMPPFLGGGSADVYLDHATYRRFTTQV